MFAVLLDSGGLLNSNRKTLESVAVWPTYVDGDVPWVYSSLDLPHLRVLPSAPEQPRGLHPEIAHLQQEVQALVTCIVTRVSLLLPCQQAAVEICQVDGSVVKGKWRLVPIHTRQPEYGQQQCTFSCELAS